ncbi:hypothetical protein DITRI_Ditri14bG0061900 [Diplodiscus trichospermus]
MVWYVWLFVISFLGVSVANWIYRWRNPKCDGRLPPGSMGLPLIGETLSFLLTSKSIDIHPFVKERMERYGPLFKTSLAGRPVVISADPDFNYFVLQQEEKLVERYYMDSFGKLAHPNNDVNAGGSVHKYLRRVILNYVGSEALKNKLLPQFEDAINHKLHEWTKQPEINAREKTAAMIFGMTSKVVMSYEEEKSKENLGQSFSNILDGLMTFPLYIPGTAFYKCIKKHKKALKVISNLVDERRNVETVSTTTSLAIKCLLDNPSALQQLAEEHEEILKKREGSNPGLMWEEYKNMTFTHYVINESLRLGSVAPGILKRVITDIHVNGYIIPKGWMLMVVPAALQLNPTKYEDPLAFDPSRWKVGGLWF